MPVATSPRVKSSSQFGFWGPLRLGRGIGGAIPRERVRRLAAGRRSVRRRRRALARWRSPGSRRRAGGRQS